MGKGQNRTRIVTSVKWPNTFLLQAMMPKDTYFKNINQRSVGRELQRIQMPQNVPQERMSFSRMKCVQLSTRNFLTLNLLKWDVCLVSVGVHLPLKRRKNLKISLPRTRFGFRLRCNNTRLINKLNSNKMRRFKLRRNSIIFLRLLPPLQVSTQLQHRNIIIMD